MPTKKDVISSSTVGPNGKSAFGQSYSGKLTDKLNERGFRKRFCFLNGIFVQLVDRDAMTIDVEASRHRGHYSYQMDAPPQLKMVPASIDLQKMSGQGVWTHPPMVLLAFISNALCILFWVLLCWARTLTFFHCVRAFYSVRSSVSFNDGKTFWLIMMVLRWWQSHHCPTGGC